MMKENRKTGELRMATLMILMTALFCFLNIFAAMQVRAEYEKFRVAQTQHIKCVEKSRLLQDGSDYLTKQTQFFIETGEYAYMKAYFDEVYSARRERAVANLITDEQQENMLVEAKKASDELMDLEYHAMRLVTEAVGMDKDHVPWQVAYYPISEEEENLTAEEKIARAKNIVYSKKYIDLKEEINTAIDEFSTSILGSAWDQIELSNVAVEKSMVLHWLSLATLIGIIAIDWQYVVYQRRLLKVQAETDGLTGLMNRRSFGHNTAPFFSKGNKTPAGFILLDVDKFKYINDNYGHDIGDQALKRLADTLQKCFRKTDVVARFGGDEFAIFLMGATWNEREIIINIIDDVNDILAAPKGGIPPFSISAGLTFLDGEDSEKEFDTVYKNTDAALYDMKKRGGRGCNCKEDAG